MSARVRGWVVRRAAISMHLPERYLRLCERVRSGVRWVEQRAQATALTEADARLLARVYAAAVVERVGRKGRK